MCRAAAVLAAVGGAAIGLPAVAFATSPPTLYVAGAGGFDAGTATDTSNTCQTESTPCATLAYAVTQASSGSTIEISGSVIEGAGANIGLNLTLTSNPDGAAGTIQGNSSDTTGLLNVTATGVSLTVDGLTLENGDNTAAYGGGAITHNVGGQLTVIDSTLADNTGSNGGAINNDDGTSGAALTIADSTLTGNFAPDGGAIDNNDHSGGAGPVTITDSTFFDNSAADGGAIDNNDNNGSNGSVTIVQSTLAADTDIQLGQEIGDSHYGGPGPVYLAADIIDGTCTNDGNAGSWTDAGYNAATDSSCLGSSPAGTDAAIGSGAGALGSLANNGGPTATLVLDLGNPASGLIPYGTSFTTGPGNSVNVVCPVAADQRGAASVPGGACDAGAVQYMNQLITLRSGVPASAVVGQSGISVSASSTSGLAVALNPDGGLTTNHACTTSGGQVTFSHTGTCVIDASQSGDQNFALAPTISSGTIAVGPASTSTSLADSAGMLTAVVSPVLPGGGTPTGTLEFKIGSQVIGTASLAGGTARLDYTARANTSQQITASFEGTGDYTASNSTAISVAGSNSKPSITAKLSSPRPRTPEGWWQAPVKVTFTCHSNGATLRGKCPAPVVLTKSAGRQHLVRRIRTIAGQSASVTVAGINVDLLSPSVQIAGPSQLRSYLLKAPAARCHAAERVSGIRSCTLTRRVTDSATGYVIHYSARATSNAGVTTKRQAVIHISAVALIGATWKRNGTYAVTPGHHYVLEVLSKTRPAYLNAAPSPLHPAPLNSYFTADGSIDGTPLWSTPIKITPGFGLFPAWTIGVHRGRSTDLLRLLT